MMGLMGNIYMYPLCCSTKAVVVVVVAAAAAASGGARSRDVSFRCVWNCGCADPPRPAREDDSSRCAPRVLGSFRKPLVRPGGFVFRLFFLSLLALTTYLLFFPPLPTYRNYPRNGSAILQAEDSDTLRISARKRAPLGILASTHMVGSGKTQSWLAPQET